MLTYCVKQKKKTACVVNSETFVVTKNGRNAMNVNVQNVVLLNLDL